MMTRFARTRRVFFIEPVVVMAPVDDVDAAMTEPAAVPAPRLEEQLDASGVHVIVPHAPHLPHGADASNHNAAIVALLHDLHAQRGASAPLVWCDTPDALPLVGALPAALVVFDCADEIARDARPASELITSLDAALASRPHVLLVGSRALLEHERARRSTVRLAPSSIDVARFASVRTTPQRVPERVRAAPPRIGFVGVIDERLDVALVRSVAALRPVWRFVFVKPGAPLVRNATRAHATARALADVPGVQMLGAQREDDLPQALAHFDVAFFPYVVDDTTRFLGPARVPDCMAAGLPIVATAVHDIVDLAGVASPESAPLVQIVGNADEAAAAIDRALSARDAPTFARSLRVQDLFLATMSWETTFEAIVAALDDVAVGRA